MIIYSTIEVVLGNRRFSLLWITIILIGFVTEAMDKYTEALAASDFSKETGNVDTLVLPILCNLAACCIQTGNFRILQRFFEMFDIALHIEL